MLIQEKEYNILLNKQKPLGRHNSNVPTDRLIMVYALCTSHRHRNSLVRSQYRYMVTEVLTSCLRYASVAHSGIRE